MLLAKDIRDRERGGRTDILLVDGDAEGGAPVGLDLMEGVLGKRTSELKAGAPDEKADQEQKSKLVLYK
jgi:advillin